MDNRQSRRPTAVATHWNARAPEVRIAQRRRPLERAIARWRMLLGAIALLNMTLWSLAATAVFIRPGSVHGLGTAVEVQLLLSAVYVLGCAFRSVLPCYDVPRIVLMDHPLASVLVGRSVATVAELCFAAQWALMVHHAAQLSGSPFGQMVALAIVPLITLAEVCSWHAVLTTRQPGHILENSIWGLSAALVVASLLVIGPGRLPALDTQMIAWSIGGAGYAAFMFLFDVPMYWARWRADRAMGLSYLTLRQGLADCRQRRVVSFRWNDWKHEIAWMTLYFSFGVWSSISLVYAALTLAAHGH